MNSGTYDITGWIDGIGDFKLGTGVAMEGKTYRGARHGYLAENALNAMSPRRMCAGF